MRSAPASRSRRRWLADDVADMLSGDFWDRQKDAALIPGRDAGWPPPRSPKRVNAAAEVHNLAGGKARWSAG
jgi:hypothetical protein